MPRVGREQTWYQSSVCTGGQSPCAQHDVQEDDTLQRLHAGRTEALKQTLRNGSQRKWVLQAPEYHRPLYRRSDTARRSSFHVAVRRWLRIVECQCHSNQLELLYYRPPRRLATLGNRTGSQARSWTSRTA